MKNGFAIATKERESHRDMSLSHSALEEQILVLNAQHGDHRAFELLVEKYDRRLLYYVRRLLQDSDAAFDVLQMTWMQVVRNLPTLKSPEAFRVWLFRIAHAQVVSRLRRNGRQPVIAAQDPAEIADTGQQTTEDRFVNAELVHLALNDISFDHRQVLTLHFLENLSVDEIAAVTDLPSGTVKSRLHYARLALRTRIEEITNG